MDSVEFGFDTRDYRRTVQKLAKAVQSDVDDAASQFALNVAARAYNTLPPQSVTAEQQRLLHYLNSTKGRTSGKRVYAIVQARRRREGKRGLGPKALSKAGRRLVARAVRKVGYVKSSLVPIVEKLNRRAPESRSLAGASSLPTPRGSSDVTVKRLRDESHVQFTIELEVAASETAKVETMLEQAVGNAIAEERAHVEDLLEQFVGRSLKG